ncbi:MAG: DNA-binding response regulator [Fluviicola sp.]|nr:MAG: DNA-binding response regulator [Fluviicola sp.]
MIKALIIEDEEYIRKGLITLIDEITSEISIVGECSSIHDALILMNACKPNLIFLDINLADGNAFDFLDQIERTDFKIIFITAHEEFALKALKQDAVDYILKPVNRNELESAISKVMRSPLENYTPPINTKYWQEENEKIILRLSDGYQVIALDELTHCMSDRGYTTFFLENGNSYMSSRSLKKFEHKLPKNQFFRVHKSYFVNMKYVDKYDRKGYVLLKTGAEIPVASRKKEEFLSYFLDESDR